MYMENIVNKLPFQAHDSPHAFNAMYSVYSQVQ